MGLFKVFRTEEHVINGRPKQAIAGPECYAEWAALSVVFIVVSTQQGLKIWGTR